MRPTIENLLTWMRTAPRTYDWSAIVAYDRTKTNVVLLQEYIGRFSTTSYLPPFDGLVATTENEVEWVYNYLVDAPRLSFENSIITKSAARLTMHIMGGSQISIASEAGRDAAVIRVASYDALQGPKYMVDIDLLYASGTVDSAGKVQLDLGSGTNPLLFFAPTLNQRTKGGQFFQGKLAGLEPVIKVFVLNEMGSQADQFLQPDEFVIRTHAEPGAKLAKAENKGEGAVLLFASMTEEPNGTLPATDEDMQFLIPAGDFSATILMGQRFLLKRILSEGCRKLARGSTPVFTLTGPAQGFADGLAVSGGARAYQAVTLTDMPAFKSIRISSVVMNLGGKFTLDLERSTELVRIHWEGSHTSACTVRFYSDAEWTKDIVLSWRATQAFKFESTGATGEMNLVPVANGQVREYRIAPGGFVDVPEVIDHYFEFDHNVEKWLSEQVEAAFVDFSSVAMEIDVFRLNSLLFRGPDVVHFTRSQIPGDLSLFGQLAPNLTRFSITPLQPLVGHGTQSQFRTDPVVAGVTWKVENIAGGTGDPGTIDTTGKYTAPAQAAIDGFFTRVRVTASKDQYSSSALVTVLVRSIVINPAIQICNYSTDTSNSTRELSAGSLSGGALTWAVKDNTGSSVVVSDDPDGDHTFIARKQLPDATVTLDEVVVTDTTGKTDSAYVVVFHSPSNAQIVLTPLPDGRIQLQVQMGSKPPLTPEQAKDRGVTWKVIIGGGNLDQVNGIYTVDPVSQFRFVAITTEVPPPDEFYPLMWGFIILPLPLVDLPTLRSALERSDAYFKAAAVLGMDAAGKLLNSER
jgi:hypothetical protein